MSSNLEILTPIIQTIIWVLLGLFIIALFYKPLNQFLYHTTKLKIGVVEIEAHIKQSAQQLPDSLQPSPNDPLKKTLSKRFANIPDRDRPYRFLVAHDVFREARPIQTALIQLGFEADIGLCPEDIEALLHRHVYDVVISNIKWDACQNKTLNGVNFLKVAHKSGFARPTVFFIQEYHPELGTPAFATGITNNWYEVIHYVLDILSREGSLE
jgi:hypothetical protein